MVDVSTLLLEHTDAVDVVRICTSSVVMWWERRDSNIRVGYHGVDNEGRGRMDSR